MSPARLQDPCPVCSRRRRGEIGHVPLVDRVRARIKDKRVLALVKAFLKAGIMTPDGEEESHSGTPQGGSLRCWLTSRCRRSMITSPGNGSS